MEPQTEWVAAIFDRPHLFPPIPSGTAREKSEGLDETFEGMLEVSSGATQPSVTLSK